MTWNIQSEQRLDDLNTLATPSVGENFVELTDPADAGPLLREAGARGWAVTVLGEGSNVVLADRLRGLVLRQACRGIAVLEDSPASVRLRVAAGENWHAFVGWCLERGYHGLENLALIPGTVGAAPIQNIGAYGVEIGPFVESVQCRELASGDALAFTGMDCEFGYRDSVFKGAWRDRLLIESVTLKLPHDASPVLSYPSLSRWLEERDCDDPGPADVFRAVVAIRSARLPNPAELPNVGSFFKNPRVSAADFAKLQQRFPAMPHYNEPDATIKLPAGWLIEQCGFRGRADPVRVHADHALVIVNPEHHRAAEVLALRDEIAGAVASRFGIQLEQEPRSYGETVAPAVDSAGSGCG